MFARSCLVKIQEFYCINGGAKRTHYQMLELFFLSPVSER